MNSTAGRLHLKIILLFLLPFFVFGQKKEAQIDKSKRTRIEAESAFIDAIKEETLENLDKAIEGFQKSIRLDPDNATAYFKIADILAKQNRFSEALVFSKEANKREKKNAYFLLQLAQMQEITLDWKGAINTYRQLIKQFPEMEYLYYSISQLYTKNRKYKDAIAELEKAEKALGPSKDNFQIRQKIYLSQNKLNEALEEGKRWMKAFPTDPEPIFSQAQIYMSNAKFDDAIKECRLLLELFPGFPAAHLMLADIYINQRKDDLADKEMELAFASPDLPIAAKIDLVSAYLRGMNSPEETARANRLTDLILMAHPADPRGLMIKGDILNKQNSRKEARDMYLKAVKGDKGNFALWEQIVLIDLNLNELDSVVAHTNEAKQLFPNTPSFSFYNGMANLMNKKYEDAVESLEQARRISVDNQEMQLEIYAQLGDAYHNLKEPEKSALAFDEVLKLDSHNAHVLNNYSYFLSLEKRNLDKALKMSTKLIQLFPEDPTYLDTHGWVLYVKKDFNAAKPILEKAAKSANSGVIWEHYGDVLFQLGQGQEAQKAWKKAAELGGEVSEFLPKKIKDNKLYE